MDLRGELDKLMKSIGEFDSKDTNIEQIEQLENQLNFAKDILEKAEKKEKELLKFNKNGQWSLDKSVIDYSKINKPKPQKDSNFKISYGEDGPKVKNKQDAWATKDAAPTSQAKVSSKGAGVRVKDRDARVQSAIDSGQVIDDRVTNKPKVAPTLDTIRERRKK